MWLCVFLLYSVLQESSGCTVERGLGATITKPAGDSVELLCSCTKQTKVDPQTVQWGFTRRFVGGDYTAEHSVFPWDSSENQHYRDRVQRLNQNQPGDLSLIISHLTEEDEGKYLCGVNGTYSRAVILHIIGSINGSPRINDLFIVIVFAFCVCVVLLLIGAMIYYLIHIWTKGSVSTNTERRTQNTVDGDYEHDPLGNQKSISMSPVYLDPNTNQSDSVYQSLNPKTNQSDSVYQSLDPNTNQSDSVYQSLNPSTIQSDSDYQCLNPNTIQSDSDYQCLNPNTIQSDSDYQCLNPSTIQSDSDYQCLNPNTNQIPLTRP